MAVLRFTWTYREIIQESGFLEVQIWRVHVYKRCPQRVGDCSTNEKEVSELAKDNLKLVLGFQYEPWGPKETIQCSILLKLLKILTFPTISLLRLPKHRKQMQQTVNKKEKLHTLVKS